MTPVPPLEGSERPFSARRSSACSVSFTVMPTRGWLSLPTSRSCRTSTHTPPVSGLSIARNTNSRGEPRDRRTPERHNIKNFVLGFICQQQRKCEEIQELTDVETETDMLCVVPRVFACALLYSCQPFNLVETFRKLPTANCRVRGSKPFSKDSRMQLGTI